MFFFAFVCDEKQKSVFYMAVATTSRTINQPNSRKLKKQVKNSSEILHYNNRRNHENYRKMFQFVRNTFYNEMQVNTYKKEHTHRIHVHIFKLKSMQTAHASENPIQNNFNESTQRNKEISKKKEKKIKFLLYLFTLFSTAVEVIENFV